jgi:hypothetical protein
MPTEPKPDAIDAAAVCLAFFKARRRWLDAITATNHGHVAGCACEPCLKSPAREHSQKASTEMYALQDRADKAVDLLVAAENAGVAA